MCADTPIGSPLMPWNLHAFQVHIGHPTGVVEAQIIALAVESGACKQTPGALEGCQRMGLLSGELGAKS